MLLDASSNDRLHPPNMSSTPTRNCTPREYSEPLDVVLPAAANSWLRSLDSSLQRESIYLEDPFDLIPDRINNFRFGDHFATRSSSQCLALTVEVAAFDRPMETLISMKSSLQKSIECLQKCNPSLFATFLLKWKKSTGRPIGPLQDLEAGETGLILKELPADFAVVYRVVFLLVNNLDVLDLLKYGQDEHAFFRAGIRYIHCLPDIILNQFLDSIDPPFSYPLEQNLLCTAVELGANQTAIAILQRRRLDLDYIRCVVSGQPYTLLERSVSLRHVEITSALLEYGLDPNRFFTTHPITIWADLQMKSDCGKLDEEVDHDCNDRIGDLETEIEVPGGDYENMKTPTTATLSIFALLVHAGAQLDTALFRTWFFKHSFSGQTLRFLLDNINGQGHGWLIDTKFLCSLIYQGNGKYGPDELIFLTKSVLDRDYPDYIRHSSTYLSELRRALYGALKSTSPNMELIKTLFFAGATPKPSDLARAVASNQVEVVELLLSAGALPDTHCLLQAILSKHVEVAKLLLHAGATLDDTYLSGAVAHDNTEFVESLLSAGAKSNTNCLLIAICKERWEHVENLISAGAVPDPECLLRAVSRMNIEVVQTLLSAGAIPDARCLSMALSSGNVDLAEIVLFAAAKPGPKCLSKAVECEDFKPVEMVLSARIMPDSDWLATAAQHANLELVEILLSAGAVPDAKGLLYAVQGGCVKIAERFLDLGLSANTMTASTTPFIEAIRRCRHAHLHLFKSKGFFVELSLGHASRFEALQAACDNKNTELVQLLLSSIQKDPSCLPNDSVKKMLQNGHQEVALKLVDFGASPDADIIVVAIEQRNALLFRRFINQIHKPYAWMAKQVISQAIQWGDLEVIKALIRAGVSLEKHDSYIFQLDEYSPLLVKGQNIYATPLVASIWMGKREVMNVLLDLGAPIRGNFGMSPLTAAILMRNSDPVRDLLQRGADPYDNLAVAIASYSRNVPLAMHLLEYFGRSYPRGKLGFGAEALHEAIRQENLPMLTVLAKHADGSCFSEFPGIGQGERSSPLGAAISSQSEKYIEMIEILLENKTNANRVVFEGLHISRTAIMHAISNRRLAAVELLIKHGAALTVQERHMRALTPLQFAADLGVEDIVQCLLKHVGPNEPHVMFGCATALQLAAIKGHYRIAVLLLRSGANVNADRPDFWGRTAFEGAAEHGRIDMMFLLAQHGANLLAYDEEQYIRAMRYSKGNGQSGAMKLVEQLYEKAIQEVQSEGVHAPDLFLDEPTMPNDLFEDWPGPDFH
jgi:ankyrin repeat protein